MNQKPKVMPGISRKLPLVGAGILETTSTSSGKANRLKHLYDDKLTRSAAIAAKFFHCMGYYIDGRADCEYQHAPSTHTCVTVEKVNKHPVTHSKEGIGYRG
jgi:hypothetical protein